MCNSNKHILGSSQVHVTAICGLHLAGHKREKKYKLAYSIEISVLCIIIYSAVCYNEPFLSIKSSCYNEPFLSVKSSSNAEE